MAHVAWRAIPFVVILAWNIGSMAWSCHLDAVGRTRWMRTTAPITLATDIFLVLAALTMLFSR